MLHPRRRAGLLAAIFMFAGATATGCAVAPSPAAVSLEQRIESAASAQDHEEIAAEFERQATSDAATARRHLGYAEIYRRNRNARGGAEAHEPLARHCEEVARNYQAVADEKIVMAGMHRELARRLVR